MDREKLDMFLKTELMKMVNFRNHNLRNALYRIEHSYRVAYIAESIAEKEGLNQEKAFVAGLLHDIGYSIEYKTFEDFLNHGRDGARIARPFLTSLGYSKSDVEEMCYGIAAHADDKSDFYHEVTPLIITIRDADTIDRTDAFRLYESLANVDYRNLSIDKQKEFVDNRLEELHTLRKGVCGTKTAQKMFEEKIDYQIEFLNRLRNQIIHSS